MPAPIVTVRGEAQLDGPPDLATVSFTVHRSGDTQTSVQSDLADASGQVRELVDQFGAAIERSSSTSLHVAPVFDRRAERKALKFRGSFATELVVGDFEALSPLVFALSSIPASQIDGPWWSLRPDNPMFRKVRLAAIAEARRRAADYVAAFDGVLTDLVEISDLDGGFTGAREMRAVDLSMAKGGDGPGFEFEPTVQTVSGQVTVRFTVTLPDLRPAAETVAQGP